MFKVRDIVIFSSDLNVLLTLHHAVIKNVLQVYSMPYLYCSKFSPQIPNFFQTLHTLVERLPQPYAMGACRKYQFGCTFHKIQKISGRF